MSFNEFINEYVELSSKISVRNEVMNASFFFAVMGALLNKKGIKIQWNNTFLKLLIHVMHIQQSRTGKGISLKVMRDFAESFEAEDEDGDIVQVLDTEEVGEATDSGLVGTVNPQIQQRNDNKGLIPGDEDYINPITYGSLATKDIIFFPEAEEMFMTGPHKEGRMKTLQLAIDGHISKRLASSMIQYDCEATIVGASYFLNEFEDIILKRGLFQRLYVTNVELTAEEIFERNDLLLSGGGDVTTIKDLNEKLKTLAKKISKVVNQFDSGMVVQLDETARDALSHISGRRATYINKNFMGEELTIVTTYTSVMDSMYMRMGAIAAVLNGKDVVTHEEIEEVEQYVSRYWASIVTDILSRIKDMSFEDAWKTIYTTLEKKENQEGLSEKELKNIVRSKLKCPPRPVNKAISMMKKTKVLIGKKDLLKLNPKR